MWESPQLTIHRPASALPYSAEGAEYESQGQAQSVAPGNEIKKLIEP
jgi:hypothetical protein